MREIDHRSPRAIADEYRVLLTSLEGFVSDQGLAEYFDLLKALEGELFDKGGIYTDPSSLMGLDIAVTRSMGEEKEVLARGVVRGIKVDPAGSLKSVVLEGDGPGVVEFDRESMEIAPARKFPKKQE
ncbi:MAG TPA: hypothetical protein VJ227_00515 [Patescibacteria group bacterium]|nr:hypothetical protein [Patescibacteria group bacterium]